MSDPYKNTQNPQINSPPQLVKPKTSGLAIASLICSLFGIFILPGLIGVILGIIALVTIKKAAGKIGGEGLALAGIIVGAVFMLLIPVLAALSAPAVTKALENASLTTEVNEMRSYGMAYNLHSEEIGPPTEMSAVISEDFYTQEMYDSLISVQSGEGNWIYFNDLTADSPGSSLLLVSPIMNRGSKRAVLRKDGSVTALEITEVETLLSEQTGSRQEVEPVFTR